MSEYVTVVIKYDDENEVPSFHAHMKALGGEITAVQFNDALAELERLEPES